MLGRKISPVLQNLLETTGINLDRGGGISELESFQDHFKEYRIIVLAGLNCDEIYFDGQVNSERRINLLYDDAEHHYHVITKVTGAMARRYVCRGCNKGCRRDVSHICDQTCSDCMSSPPCALEGIRIPCDACNRHFRSRACFDKPRKKEGRNKKTVCECKRCCSTCGVHVTRANHECNKRYCETCNENKEVGHLSYMWPLKVESLLSDGVLYVFYDFETTQNTTLHVPKLVCLQQFCS
jgi:hypothetical protein